MRLLAPWLSWAIISQLAMVASADDIDHDNNDDEGDQAVVIGDSGLQGDENDAGEQETILQPNCIDDMDKGDCKAYLTRYYYRPDTKTCEEFKYGGCRGNGNNFRSLKACEEFCITNNTKLHEEPIIDVLRNESDYETLVFLNPETIPWLCLATFEDEEFKELQPNNMKIVPYKRPAHDEIDTDKENNETSEEEDDDGDDQTEDDYGAAPIFDENNEDPNATLVYRLVVEENYDYVEVECSVKIVGYKKELPDEDEAQKNPFFSIELIRDVDKVETSRLTLFDIRNYGGAFERLTNVTKLRIALSAAPSHYILTFTTRLGAKDNTVILDDIRLRKSQRFTRELALKLDEEAEKESSNENDGGDNGGNDSGSEEGNHEDGGDGDDDEDTPEYYGHTGEIVLACIAVALAIALAAVSFKYCRLRQEMVGNYKVSSPSGPNQPAYDNPLYSGHHMPADRFGEGRE